MKKLGLIAGGGDLPASVAARCEAEGRPLYVIRLDGFAEEAMLAWHGETMGMAQIGGILKALRREECEAVCLAGYVNRPDFKALKPDLKGATLLPGIIAAATKGDDALLRKILGVFEAEGFSVEGADDILGGYMLSVGPLGSLIPDEKQIFE